MVTCLKLTKKLAQLRSGFLIKKGLNHPWQASIGQDIFLSISSTSFTLKCISLPIKLFAILNSLDSVFSQGEKSVQSRILEVIFHFPPTLTPRLGAPFWLFATYGPKLIFSYSQHSSLFVLFSTLSALRPSCDPYVLPRSHLKGGFPLLGKILRRLSGSFPWTQIGPILNHIYVYLED